MKILHAISGLNVNSGGPSISTWSLVTGLRNTGIEADLIAYKSNKSSELMIGKGDFVYSLPSPKYSRFAYSSQFNRFLEKDDYEIYHGHGLWQYPVHCIAVYARKMGKPYLISTRGMLYPEALRKSSYVKKIALQIYQRKDLELATVIHATCNQELQYIRDSGFKNPVAIIPNSINTKVHFEKGEFSAGKSQVGFLGRFAPIKNIENLIEAWDKTCKNNPDWELVLIGDGELTYKNQLTNLTTKLGIKNIRFTGFLNGTEKEKALQKLSYLVLPSKSENFGMVVTEALIRGIPVISSKGTPWEELNTYRAGWWIDIGVGPLARTLNEAISLPENERRIMGQNGRQLVEQNYSLEQVTRQMISLYGWLLGKGSKPDFVYT